MQLVAEHLQAYGFTESAEALNSELKKKEPQPTDPSYSSRLEVLLCLALSEVDEQTLMEKNILSLQKNQTAAEEEEEISWASGSETSTDEWSDDEDMGYYRVVIPSTDPFYKQRNTRVRTRMSSSLSTEDGEPEIFEKYPNLKRKKEIAQEPEEEEKQLRKLKLREAEQAALEKRKKEIREAKINKFEHFDLRVYYIKNQTGFEESKDFPIKINSVIAGRYEILEYLGSAAFSKAIQCLDLKKGELVCLKIIKNNKDFFDQSLDEIKLLKYLNSNCDPDEKHIVRMFDYFYFKEHLFIVCELLRDNLYEFYKYNRESGDELYFTMPRLQRISTQCLTALEYIHSLNLIHCDLKPENILIKSYSRCETKVIDFGSSCFIHDHLSSYVQSRSYRAPEVMLGLPYGRKIDIWSLGCIIAELWTGEVLFLNDSIPTLLARILGIIGLFPKKMMKGQYVKEYFTPDNRLFEKDETTGEFYYLYPKKTNLQARLKTDDQLFISFIKSLLTLDPDERPSATQALKHPWLSKDYSQPNK